MKFPTAILQEQYEHRWVREQERIIDAHRRARRHDWMMARWRRRLLWAAGLALLGSVIIAWALWMVK